VITKTIAAAIRAVLVANLAALPSLILPHETADMAQFVAIMSLLLGGLVFIEYAGRTPSLTEFRYAPPYNRRSYRQAISADARLSVFAHKNLCVGL